MAAASSLLQLVAASVLILGGSVQTRSLQVDLLQVPIHLMIRVEKSKYFSKVNLELTDLNRRFHRPKID